MAFSDKAFFNRCKTLQFRWIVLAHCHVYKIFGRKFGNIVAFDGCIAKAAEVPRISIATATIQAG
jgi:hypothetical protein